MSKPKKSKKRSGTKLGPVRVLVDCSPHRTTGGRYIEELTQHPIEHESPNEKHALWLLPLCHDVLQIRTQASEEPYANPDGGTSHHTPDITVEMPGGDIVIEIKSLSWLVNEKELNKYLHVARGYLIRGKCFAFLVDAQLEQKPLFQSVNLLRRYVRCEINQSVCELIIQQLQDGPLCIHELITRSPAQLVDVYVLIARKVICFDWTKPLDCESLVSLPSQPFEGLKFENILRSTRYGRLLEELALGRRPADQSILADAANWRQHRQPPGPFQMVGGFAAGVPLRDLGQEESRTGKSWDRRHFALGAFPLKTDFA